MKVTLFSTVKLNLPLKHTTMPTNTYKENWGYCVAKAMKEFLQISLQMHSALKES